MLNSAVVNSYGAVTFSSGGLADVITVNDKGQVVIEDSATVYSAYVSSGGLLQVSSGGDLNVTAILDGGWVFVNRGGSATGIMVMSQGNLMVTGGHVSGAMVYSNGSMAVVGGTADHGYVSRNATLIAYGDRDTGSNGIVKNYTVIDGGILSISSGGVATGNMVVSSGGWVRVEEDGLLESATIYTDGLVTISSGGTADLFFVLPDASVVVHGLASEASIASGGVESIFSGGTANSASVFANGSLFISSGGKATGRLFLEDGAVVSAAVGATIDFNISLQSPGNEAMIDNLGLIQGSPDYTLTTDAWLTAGTYTLAKGATGFDGVLSVIDYNGGDYGFLSFNQNAYVGEMEYTLTLDNGTLAVQVSSVSPGPGPGPEPVVTTAARGDRDGNGISDVMFVWTGNTYAHGYWMNGSNEWWSANSPGISPDWDNLGSYDMSGDGRADAVMFGNVVVNGAKGAYIGYYQDGDDVNGWVQIGYLDNSQDIEWHNAVGNLTGSGDAFDPTGAAMPAATPLVNSIVWHAPELGALGAWTEGTDSWVTIGQGGFDEHWTLIGCGDFSYESNADSVVMAYDNGAKYYAVAIDGSTKELGESDSGWEVRAIGDFNGNDVDDIVAFHKETGLVAMWSDGLCARWIKLGQLDAKDWFVAGCGDYNGDGTDDLLVRQYSTGMLGYYSNGNMDQWNVLGYGVDMDWTVIA